MVIPIMLIYGQFKNEHVFSVINWLCIKDRMTSHYGTAQFELDIYTHVAVELFNKFVELLASFRWVHMQYNFILDPLKWCTCKVHYSQATYHTLCVICTHGHLWIILPLILCNVHSIQTLWIIYNCLNHSTTMSITAGIVQFRYTVPKKRNSSEHVLQAYLISAGTPNVSKIHTEDGGILCTSWSISGRMIQRWPRMQFTRNIQYVACK